MLLPGVPRPLKLATSALLWATLLPVVARAQATQRRTT
jgi:hypothetical protein